MVSIISSVREIIFGVLLCDDSTVSLAFYCLRAVPLVEYLWS